jgi:hypothetical protein
MHRIRHDVAFAAAPMFTEPLQDVLDEWQLGELRVFYYETLLATLEAFETQLEQERHRLDPLLKPSKN